MFYYYRLESVFLNVYFDWIEVYYIWFIFIVKEFKWLWMRFWRFFEGFEEFDEIVLNIKF